MCSHVFLFASPSSGIYDEHDERNTAYGALDSLIIQAATATWMYVEDLRAPMRSGQDDDCAADCALYALQRRAAAKPRGCGVACPLGS